MAKRVVLELGSSTNFVYSLKGLFPVPYLISIQFLPVCVDINGS